MSAINNTVYFIIGGKLLRSLCIVTAAIFTFPYSVHAVLRSYSAQLYKEKHTRSFSIKLFRRDVTSRRLKSESQKAGFFCLEFIWSGLLVSLDLAFVVPAQRCCKWFVHKQVAILFQANKRTWMPGPQQCSCRRAQIEG